MTSKNNIPVKIIKVPRPVGYAEQSINILALEEFNVKKGDLIAFSYIQDKTMEQINQDNLTKLTEPILGNIYCGQVIEICDITPATKINGYCVASDANEILLQEMRITRELCQIQQTLQQKRANLSEQQILDMLAQNDDETQELINKFHNLSSTNTKITTKTTTRKTTTTKKNAELK